MDETITLTRDEVVWIISQLSLHFLVKECRDVSRFLSAKVKTNESDAV